MKMRTHAPDPRLRRDFKRTASFGLGLFAIGVMALIYMRTL